MTGHGAWVADTGGRLLSYELFSKPSLHRTHILPNFMSMALATAAGHGLNATLKAGTVSRPVLTARTATKGKKFEKMEFGVRGHCTQKN